MRNQDPNMWRCEKCGYDSSYHRDECWNCGYPQESGAIQKVKQIFRRPRPGKYILIEEEMAAVLSIKDPELRRTPIERMTPFLMLMGSKYYQLWRAALNDADLHVRIACIHKLGEVAENALVALGRDPDDLGGLKDGLQEMMGLLSNTIRTEETSAMREAYYGVQAILDPVKREVVYGEIMLRSQHVEVRNAVGDAFVSAGGFGVDAVSKLITEVSLFTSSDKPYLAEWMPIYLIGLLTRFPPATLTTATFVMLLDIYTSKEGPGKEAALKALRKITAGGGNENFLALRDHPDEDVRMAAIEFGTSG